MYSFDLFDTLITRRVATPRGVFVWMQRALTTQDQGLPRALCERFADERVHAEYSARIQASERAPDATHKIAEEIDIHDIYSWLANRHGLEDVWIDRLIELEIQAEERFLYGVPEMLARFHALARNGERIVLVSDMYLRRQDIVRILNGIDPFLLEYARLYLSSEIKLNKASGRMFAHVAEQEQVALSSIHHIGDNPHSDIARARECGCQTTFFDACHLSGDENFERHEEAFGWQISAGLFRQCRLTLESDRARIGGLYAAITLLPFTLWVLQQARAAGHKRLYFFARDGQVLLDIARRLPSDDLELRYLHVSRLALHRCVNTDLDTFLDWVFVSHQGMTLEDIAYRITSTPEALIETLQSCVGADVPVNTELTHAQKRAVRARFESDQKLRTQVFDLVSLEREQTLNYLDQEGIADLHKVCVVDVGWSGSIQDSLYEILRTRAGRTPTALLGLYWGLQRHTHADTPENRKIACAFHPDTFRRDPTALREIVECFTAADHGSTLGYADRDGRYRPILNTDGAPVIAWGLADFRQGIDAFIEPLLDVLTESEIIALMPYSFRRLQHLVQYPSTLLAREIGRFPYSPDPTGALAPFAPALSVREALLYQVRSGSRRGTITRWRQGSLVNSRSSSRYLISSKSSALFSVIKGIHPRGVVDALPYPVIAWAKRKLPTPMLRACRAFLRR